MYASNSFRPKHTESHHEYSSNEQIEQVVIHNLDCLCFPVFLARMHVLIDNRRCPHSPCFSVDCSLSFSIFFFFCCSCVDVDDDVWLMRRELSCWLFVVAAAMKGMVTALRVRQYWLELEQVGFECGYDSRWHSDVKGEAVVAVERNDCWDWCYRCCYSDGWTDWLYCCR